MVSVTLRLRAVPEAALALAACVLLIAGCSGVSTQQSEQPPPAPLAVGTTSLPNGEVNTAYSATLAATGGTAPYSWTLAAGTLPSGITLDRVSLIDPRTSRATASFVDRSNAA